ncbi:MAG: hypothetical protein HRU25_15440 [Psychrobium sp.]|nr:hypothetical protein [Psychrobium sp.]
MKFTNPIKSEFPKNYFKAFGINQALEDKRLAVLKRFSKPKRGSDDG